MLTMAIKNKYVGIRCTEATYQLLKTIATNRNTTLTDITRVFYLGLIKEYYEEVEQDLINNSDSP